MNKKKLLVTASTFPRYEGDTEPRFVLDLCKELNRYFNVTVLVPAAIGSADRETIEGVKVIRYHYFPLHRFETLCYPGAIVPRIKEKKSRILLVPFLLLSLYFHLAKLLKEYDMVHAHWIIPQGIIQSFFKTPYIVTGHGGDVTSLNKGILKLLKKKALKKAAGVTTVSQALADEVFKIQKVPHLEIISMGCNTKNFTPDYRVVNYFNQNDSKVILFVGRLAEKKGVTYLIEAMSQVEAKLVIVGGGPLENQLKEQARKINAVAAGRIEFLGSKTHDELKLIYASADIFCAPSITASDGDQEGFGLVILEAMASGLPVVASNSGGIVDLINDSHDGLLSEEKNSDDIAKNLNRLIEDRGLYEALREQAIKTSHKYDYEVIGEKYRDLFYSIQEG